MPIFEFKCMKCGEFMEVLVMGSSDEDKEMKCAKCGAEEFERVLSVTSHNMKGGVSASCSSGQSATSPFTQTRSCSSGSCTTYTVPGG